MHASSSQLSPFDLVAAAFAGLPRPARSGPRVVHTQTRVFVVRVRETARFLVRLELHERSDGPWFWEYAENRFGQLQLAGVFDGYALYPEASSLHATAEDALVALTQQADLRLSPHTAEFVPQ